MKLDAIYWWKVSVKSEMPVDDASTVKFWLSLYFDLYLRCDQTNVQDLLGEVRGKRLRLLQFLRLRIKDIATDHTFIKGILLAHYMKAHINVSVI